MRVETVTYNAPETEYRFDTEGRLIEALPTGQTGNKITHILHAEADRLLKNKKTGLIVGEQVQIEASEDSILYEEIENKEF